LVSRGGGFDRRSGIRIIPILYEDSDAATRIPLV
jgi:hypothetical protein